MIAAIADTHTAIWYLFSDPRLGKAAATFIESAVANGAHIGISAISLAEMVYLAEKGRIPANALADLRAAMGDPRSVLQHIALDAEVAMQTAEVPRQEIPDLPDRVIAATARLRGYQF